ncbi:MAG TPA: prolyl oligopeptidase family serine peptidase [Kineosporiaceae bacterium]
MTLGTRPVHELPEPATPFHDLDRYLALPRLSGLVLSPAGDRLVTVVSALDPERSGYVTALWEVDPAGERPARRLTRSAKGEQNAAFLPGGDLLFVSTRPDQEAKRAGDDPRPALWVLPEGGGEARVVASRPGGISGVAVARDEGTVVLVSPTMPSAAGADDDEKARTRRKEGKVTAILHQTYPIRFWDHDLGPDEPRLLAGHVPAVVEAGVDPLERGRVALRDLTPAPGRALHEARLDVSPDGSRVVTTWAVAEPGGSVRSTLVAIDTATGHRVVLVDDPQNEYSEPAFSPDGRRVAAVAEARTTPTRPPVRRLVVIDPGLAEVRGVAESWDRWPGSPVWGADGRSLFVTADEGGRSPIFRVDLGAVPGDDTVTRLCLDDGAYTDVRVSPDGAWVYALRSAVDAPPAPVRLDARTPGLPQPLPAPASAPALPGSLTEVTATADDGTRLRSWLVLPAGASDRAPAPLLLWVHGGPLMSWNSWSWRWNPWLMAAAGYAVLLPDPALSTGYGDAFVSRGWGAWGSAPYLDLMALTDAAEKRPDVDAERTAVMGGSFGGYMANWIAGHTDRFRGIVSHAGLWALDQMGPTTDAAYYWARELSAEMVLANSPHRFVDEIRTPMLVIHGDRDYRVPIGEALRLWWELNARSGEVVTPHRFLYFPTENHWVVAPQHAKLWYQTVLAFLAVTVHDRPWEVPELLR